MIPVFDLEGIDTVEKCENLVLIMSSVGFVYLENHGVSSENIKACRNVFNDFFSLPENYKESFTDDSNQDNPFLGYKRCESERLNPNRKEKDFRESMLFWAHDIRVNKWPNSSMEDVTVDLVDELGVLAKRLLKMIGIGLGVKDRDTFSVAHSAFDAAKGDQTKSFTTFRVNHYPKLEPGQLKEDQALCGEHADYGSITLLIQDNVGGLEVQTTNGDYIEATPIEDTILVNVGLMLENWTNGRLRATRHRVISYRNESRMSLVLFALPDQDVLVEPMEELKDKNTPSEYEGVMPNDLSRQAYLQTL